MPNTCYKCNKPVYDLATNLCRIHHAAQSNEYDIFGYRTVDRHCDRCQNYGVIESKPYETKLHGVVVDRECPACGMVWEMMHD